MKRIQMMIATSLSLILMAGCTNSEQTTQVKGFAAVMDTWPAPLEGHGRLVFFSPPYMSSIPQNQEGIGTRINEANITILSEDHTGRFNLDEETAGYIDVPQGDYAINVRLASVELEQSVEAGKTYFIKTQIRDDGFCDNATLADSHQAEKVIRKKHLDGTAPSLPLTLIPRTGIPMIPVAFDPSAPPAAGRCRLVLFRSSGIVGLIMPIHVGLDCPPQVKVPNKRYCVIDSPAGEHVLTLSYSPNLAQGLADTYRVGLKVDLPADESYHVGFFNVDDLSQITPLSKTETAELMSKSSLAKDGTLKAVPPDEKNGKTD